jgi:hypothetical protein
VPTVALEDESERIPVRLVGQLARFKEETQRLWITVKESLSASSTFWEDLPMWGLEKIADAFDKMHAEVQHDLDDVILVKNAQWYGKTFGPDSFWNWENAISAGITWSLATYIMGAGKSLVDLLRIGEGVKSGTLGGVGQDALRVMNLIPVVGLGARTIGTGGRLASIAWASRVAGQGGEMSCAPTAMATALRMSGRSMTMTVEEISAAAGQKTISPFAKNYPGLTMNEVATTIKGVTPAAQDIDLAAGTGVSTIDAVEAAAAQGRGPVIYGIQWPGGNAASGWATTWWDADHAMVAFRNAAGEVMVADQTGVRPIAEAGTIFGKSIAFNVTPQALLVEDGILVRTLGAAQSAGEVMTGARGGAGWLASAFAIQMIVVNGRQTQVLDSTVREMLGRPPRDWTQPSGELGRGGGGSDPSSPEQDVPLTSLPPEAQRLYNSLPPGVAVNWKQARSSIVPPLSDPYGSLKLLENAGKVKVSRYGFDDMNVSTITCL